MIVFFGKSVIEKCICGELKSFCYGACTKLYEDENGEFDIDHRNVCDQCGHVINSERIENAKYIGSCCY